MAVDTAELDMTAEAPVDGQEVVRALREIQDVSGVSFGNLDLDDTGNAQFMYYRKPADCGEPGYIFIESAHPYEYQARRRMGCVPLDQYGTFEDISQKVSEFPGEQVLRGAKWDIHREAFRRILARGGAHEFPVAQVLELRWHLKPPYPGVTFPQLEGVEIKSFRCSYCAQQFTELLHLQKHEQVTHKDTSQQTQMARHLARANTGVLKQVIEQQTELLEKQQTLADKQASTDNRLAQALEVIAASQAMLAQLLVPQPVAPATKKTAPAGG